MDILAPYAQPLLGALFWRLRGMGGPAGPAWLWALAFSLLCAGIILQAGHPLWSAAIYALWINIGERPGWGAPIGQIMGEGDPNREPEWYQLWFGGFMWKNPWVALAFRGALIGGIGAIVFPLSVWLHKHVSRRIEASNEWWFGGLFVLMLMGVVNAA